ncbi:molybdopterin-dependent oxidoreductase-like protein [Sediminihabitans luteus]|uniref:Molybdopterin-dependent oxidoreductase-like protein n=1 Tax=Sediminihabitans luteus TaxID=1138585 RepID=A0A2M9CEW2_9CELL|nr:molybdopterin-dependent oxidoreductase [Sediminihabitans luteus]PJJ70390.1 molybdopterin-dependent oxidoreductase-like protein [Sediminihabitans luteus]GII97862.1 molybdopterin-binding protein [Sediminihabitans luteus]
MGLPRPPTPEAFRSPIHDERVVARVGVWLGIAFVVVFVTGLVSHFLQNPLPWMPLLPEPSWGYRVTQGVHVAAGIACLPLLLAKLYAVYPALFESPPVKSPAHALERASVALLVASSIFQLVTGLFNVFQWYPWAFSFVAVHYATAWVVIGSLVIHVGVKLPIIVRALRTRIVDGEIVDEGSVVPAGTLGVDVVAAAGMDGQLSSVPDGENVVLPVPDADGSAATRRGFLAGVAVTVLGLTALTVGQTVRPLAPLAVLAPRDPRVGPQGLPVNKTAAAAGVSETAVDPAWVLRLEGPGGTRELDRAALLAMDLHEAVLPIACVEGWSATARWEGVRVRDLVAMVGAQETADLAVESLQQGGSYSRSVLQHEYVAHDDTLLALRLDGEDLDVDHGFPARIIAPNRPGVLQTKWVARLSVIDGGAA